MLVGMYTINFTSIKSTTLLIPINLSKAKKITNMFLYPNPGISAPVIYSYAGKEPFKSSNSSPFFKCSLSKADSKKYLSSSQK